MFNPGMVVGQSKESLGIDVLEAEADSQRIPNSHTFGTLFDYPSPGSPPSSEIQYLRVVLHSGDIIDNLQYFLESNGTAARNLRMALYEQADPADNNGEPTNRIAQTNEVNTDHIGQPLFVSIPLTDAATGGSGTPTTWQVPISGFYWIALITDNTVAKYAVSPVYRANYLPVRRESGAGNVLPASAGVLVNPASALVYVAAISQ